MKHFLALILLSIPVLAQTDEPAPEPKLSDTLGTAELLLLKLRSFLVPSTSAKSRGKSCPCFRSKECPGR